MENSLVFAEYPLERHTSKNSIKKNKKKRITHAQNSYKPKHHRKYYSNKNNNLIQIHSFDYSEKAPSKKNVKVIILIFLILIIKKIYSKNSLCFLIKKFKLSNNFDAKNSKKFLDKKDKYLSKIILSDEIENEKNNDDSLKKISKDKKSKFKTEKNVHQYFIVISNYDEDLKNKTNIKTSLNLDDIYKD